MVGLKEQTVHGAKSIAEARARHRWHIPADYHLTIDCLERPFQAKDRIALYYEDDEGHSEKYTWGQLRLASNKLANAMRALGVARGDVVAVHTPQRPETAIMHMALYRLGAIALPISKLFGPDAIRYRLNNSSAKAILMEPETVGKLDGIRDEIPTLKHVVVAGGKGEGHSFDNLLAKGADQFAADRAPLSEDPILLMYTSGTTGNPKGVLHAARYRARPQRHRLFVQFPARRRPLLQPRGLGVGGRTARRSARGVAVRNSRARLSQQGALRSRRDASACSRSTAPRSGSIRRPRSRRCAK